MDAWEQVTRDDVLRAMAEYDRLGPDFATGERLDSGDFEGGRAGAVRVLEKLGFTVQPLTGPAS